MYSCISKIHWSSRLQWLSGKHIWPICGRSPDWIQHPTSAETHMWDSDWWPYWLSRGQQMSHQRWISGIIYHVAWPLWKPEETSPEVQNSDIIGPTKRLMSSKFFFKKSLWSNKVQASMWRDKFVQEVIYFPLQFQIKCICSVYFNIPKLYMNDSMQSVFITV